MLDVMSKGEYNEPHKVEKGVPFDLDDICDQLQDYLWQTPQDDLDSLGYHYEFDSIDNVSMVKHSSLSDDSFRMSLLFDSSVTVYLDNEDDSGVSYSFLTKADFDEQKADGKWMMDAENMKL